MNDVEYIRSTHRFDNCLREWIYRGDRGEDKHVEWNTPEIIQNTVFRRRSPFYSFGVHALKDDRWMGMDWVVDETIKMYIEGASDRTLEFKEFMDTNPNYRDIVRRDVLEELEYLVSVGMVMKRVV